MSNTFVLPITTTSVGLSVNFWNESLRSVVTHFRESAPPGAAEFNDLQSVLPSGIPTGVLYRSQNGVAYFADSSYRRTAGANAVSSPWTRNGVGARFESSIAALAANIDKMETGELVTVTTSNARVYLITDATTGSFVDVGIPPLNSIGSSFITDGSITSAKLASNLVFTGSETIVNTGNLRVSNGGIGIGVADPGVYKLSVNGAILANYIAVTNSTAILSGLESYKQNTYGWLFVGKSLSGVNDSGFWLEEASGNVQVVCRDNAGAIRVLFSANTAQPSWITGGNVGIGTSTPATKLQVAGTIYSSTGGFRFPDGTNQTSAASSVRSAVYTYQFSSGVDGPVPVNATWTQISLNAEPYDPTGLGAISAGRVNLIAGTYKATFDVSTYGTVGVARARLYNHTDSGIIVESINSANPGDTIGIPVVGGSVFSISATKNIALQYYFSGVGGSGLLGKASGGGTEYYAIVRFDRIGEAA